jgi:Asp/Glu/hydantoin racemase
VPVLPSDQALFDQVARHAPTCVAVLGPVRAGVVDTVARLRDRIGDARVTGTVVDGSRAATSAGDLALLDRLVADEARRAEPDADLVVLGQFSISPAHAAAQAAVSVPVLSPPHLAADVLREHFEART